MRKCYYLLLVLLLLTGCGRSPEQLPTVSAPEPTPAPTSSEETFPTASPADPIEEALMGMTTEEKVGQLFLARYDRSAPTDQVTAYHPGGLIFFSEDFRWQTPTSMAEKLADLQRLASIPMLMAVDEEGGTVTRISRFIQYRGSPFPSPRALYASGGKELVLETEREKCRLLSSLGLNVNMGPVCDITTDPGAFMYQRSLGQDPLTTGILIAALVETMSQEGIGSLLKHFPGYGNNADTHIGIARDSRSLEALEAADLVPFSAGIDAGCGAVLVSHTIVEALDPVLPASLSPAVIGYLREHMGFDGVVVTDDLVMEAITDAYGPEEAAILAVLAGNDLLCSTQYALQYQAVLGAVREGRIPPERIDEAVARVLRWKQTLGLLTFDADF